MRLRPLFTGLIVGAAASVAAALAVAQPDAGGGPAPDKSAAPAPAPPAPTATPAVPMTPEAEPSPSIPDEEDNETVSEKPAPAKPEAAAKPAPPPTPLRSPAAILQALDKVTAETIRFEAPIGQRVRYKTLIFTVKACETTGLGDAAPQASAYLVIESQPMPLPGHAPPPAKQVYNGWMFAQSPSLHPLQHPVYDAWLIACKAATPAA